MNSFIILLLIGCLSLMLYFYTSELTTDNRINQQKKCTPTKYKFAFILDESVNKYKVHGLWIDECKENISKRYPIFCNSKYTSPHDPTNFIINNWYHQKGLFKYEYDKHGSCFGVNSTEYLYLIIQLYDKYYEKYIKKYHNYKQVFLLLDQNFDYVGEYFVRNYQTV